MVAILAAALAASQGDNWAEFRGPNGTGHSEAKGLPREWSETQNVVWKTPVRGKGWSSPVVWGRQVWLTSATPDGKEHFAVCIDRETGKTLLDEKLFDLKAFEAANGAEAVKKHFELFHKYNSYASPSPVIEEGRVYLHWGSPGTACLDTATFKPVWIRQDLACDHHRGAGSSPILWKDLLILQFDGFDQQYAVALDKKTGKTVWKAPRTHPYPVGSDGDTRKGYGTPIVVELGGKAVLLSPAAQALVALDPATGKQLWQFRHPEHSAATRPLFGNGLIFLSTGFGKANLLAIRPDGKEDITSTNLAWKQPKGIGSKPSPLLVGDLLYVGADGGLASCFDAKTGEQVWQQRLVSGTFTASPIFADGAVYYLSDDGSSAAVQPGREFKVLGKGKLEPGASKDAVTATPAAVGKSLFIRTATHLYRIEAK